MQPKPPHVFRLWSNNVNGLSLHDSGSSLHDLCISLSQAEVDCVALQETNIDWTQPRPRDLVRHIFSEHFGMVQLTTSTSPIQVDSAHYWKPGGILLVLLGKWASASIRKAPDSLGRWTSLSIIGKSTQVTIFSVYNSVATRLSDAGPYTVFAQQYAALKAAGIAQPNPRLQFIRDFHDELRHRARNQEAFIIVGDLNEVVGRDPDLFASISSTYDLFDAHDFFLGESADVPTYNRGSNRIDYCFMSTSLRSTYSASGFNPFHLLYPSDHRAHYLDITLSSFLGQQPPLLAPPSLREISSHSVSVKKFVSVAYDHLHHTNAFKTLRSFETTAASDTHPWVTANTIDSLLQQAFDLACKTCLKPPRPPWSEKLHVASKRVRYWKTHLSALHTGVSHAASLDTLACSLWPHSPPARPHSIRITRSALRAALKRLRSLRQDAFQERKEFLQHLRLKIAARIHKANTDPEKAMKSLLRQLRDKRMFQRIQRALKPTNNQALTHVRITQTSVHLHPTTGNSVTLSDTQVVDIRDQLEAAIIQRNKTHFAQAKDTPWRCPPFDHITSNTDFRLTAADGSPLDTHSCFHETDTILRILQDRAPTSSSPSWSSKVSFQDFISGLLHWREQTATSPSGRHLGIYKALTTAHLNSSGEFGPSQVQDGPLPPRSPSRSPSSPVAASIQEKATAILQGIHSRADIATRDKFYLKRWTQVINVMIYKNPGCTKLNRLQVIHSFDADFNLIVGILFGRPAMRFQSRNNLIYPGQFGQPGGECQDAAMGKVLH